MKTMSTSPSSSGVGVSTVISWPFTDSRLPADLSDAHRRMELAGTLRCSSTRSNTWPTAPVAPTTAILGPSKPLPSVSVIGTVQ